jgi:hypothetical protein
LISVRLAPPNSLLLVLDPRSGVLPLSMDGSSVASTDSGLAVGTVAEQDGETTVWLGRSRDLPVDRSLSLAWTGSLRTTGRVAILTVYNEVVVEIAAPPVATVQVWTNDPVEPDVVCVTVE